MVDHSPRRGSLTSADVLSYALGRPGAWQDEPWEGDLVAKVADKIFVFLGDTAVGVKCGANRDEADEWLHRFPDDASVMAYIGRSGWNRRTRPSSGVSQPAASPWPGYCESPRPTRTTCRCSTPRWG